ncbi:MAG: amidohydrolase [Gemmataceae bacterium]
MVLQRIFLLFLFQSLGFVQTVQASIKPADLVLTNGKIVTLDKRFGVVQALAAHKGKIYRVGKNSDVAKFIGPKTTVIDLKGKLAIPGFIECHAHFVSLGRSKMMLPLARAKSWDDIIEQVKTAAKKTPKGEWIIGRGWHQEKWSTKPKANINGYPIHTRLSEITPDHPVLLTHASGHMCFANAEAMRLAKVTKTTSNPSGGEILKDGKGNPIGVFRETAQGLVQRAYQQSLRDRTPEQQKKELTRAIELATEECLRNGVTSFQDAGSSFGTIATFKKLAEQGKLKVRLWVMVRTGNMQLARLLSQFIMVGFGDNFLTVKAIKVIFDGALGAHGAWLLEPYEDLPMKTGLNTTSLASLRKTAEIAVKNKCQLCVHAIGDRANREVLNVFEATFKNYPSKNSRRWRVEHAQHLHPTDIPRFSQLGVIASMQGVHCTSDAAYVLSRLGYRRASEGAYMWQSLLRSGAIIANGTDAPVEDISPIECFYASVTRKLANGAVFFEKQKMTRQQALKSYTVDAAFAAFEEKIKGTLSPGKLADIVVLSKDLLTIPDREILNTRVDYTIVGGRVMYQRKKFR